MLSSTIHIHGFTHVRAADKQGWLDLRDDKGHEITLFHNATDDGAAWWRQMAVAILQAVDQPGKPIRIATTESGEEEEEDSDEC